MLPVSVFSSSSLPPSLSDLFSFPLSVPHSGNRFLSDYQNTIFKKVKSELCEHMSKIYLPHGGTTGTTQDNTGDSMKMRRNNRVKERTQKRKVELHPYRAVGGPRRLRVLQP